MMNIITELISAGTENRSYEKVNDIKLINQVSLVGMIMCIVLSIIAIPLSATTYAIVNVVTLLFCLFVIILNHFRKDMTARIVFSTILPLSMVAYVYLFGNIGAEDYLIVGAILGAYLLRKSFIGHNIAFVSSSLGYIGCKLILWLKYEEIIMIGFQPYIFWPNILCSLILIYATTLFFKSVHERQRLNLNQLSQTRGKLLSILSHDLKSPINSLHMISANFSNPALTNEDKDMLMEELTAKLGSTSSLLDNMLIWVKKQMDGINPTISKVNIVDVIRANISLLNREIREKKLIIRFDHSEPVITSTDLEMVNLIVRNILSNAIKFSHHSKSKITFDLESRANLVYVIIEDNGIGMTDEQVSNLFIEQRTEMGTHNEAGFGIGLLLVKDFLDILGQSIDVKSSFNHGTTVRFTLPRA